MRFSTEAVKNAKPVKKNINITKIVIMSRVPKFSSNPLMEISSPATMKIVNIIFKSVFILIIFVI